VNMATGVEGHYKGCELTPLQFVKLYGYNEENLLKLCESHGLINLKTNCRKCGKLCSDEKNCNVYENKKCKPYLTSTFPWSLISDNVRKMQKSNY